MKNLIFGMFGIFALIGSMSASAACDANGCIGVGDEAVASVYLTALPESSVYLEAPSATKGNLNCSLAEGSYMTLQSDHPLFKETYATILTALAADQLFRVRTKSGTPNCEIAFVKVIL